MGEMLNKHLGSQGAETQQLSPKVGGRGSYRDGVLGATGVREEMSPPPREQRAVPRAPKPGLTLGRSGHGTGGLAPGTPAQGNRPVPDRPGPARTCGHAPGHAPPEATPPPAATPRLKRWRIYRENTVNVPLTMWRIYR